MTTTATNDAAAYDALAARAAGSYAKENAPRYTVTDFSGRTVLATAANKPNALRWVEANPSDQGFRVVTPGGTTVASAIGAREAALARGEERKAANAVAEKAYAVARQAGIAAGAAANDASRAADAAWVAVSKRAYAHDEALAVPATMAVAMDLLRQAGLAPTEEAPAEEAPARDREVLTREPAPLEEKTVAAATTMAGRAVRVTVDGAKHLLAPVRLEYREGRKALWAGEWTHDSGARVLLVDGRWRAADGSPVPTMAAALASHLAAR